MHATKKKTIVPKICPGFREDLECGVKRQPLSSGDFDENDESDRQKR